MARVTAYVDGFNLYFGMRSRKWPRYYWLNVQLLVQNLLKPDQRLMYTKYFTSRVSSTPADPEKSKRQNTYLEALATPHQFKILYGHYLGQTIRGHNCGAYWDSHEEKMTDVNIAVELVTDAFQDSFATALLISADSDLTAPVEAVRRLFPQKRVVVGFPPFRRSKRLHDVANSSFTIGRKKVADSQFPGKVRKPDGYVLQRPTRWQ